MDIFMIIQYKIRILNINYEVQSFSTHTSKYRGYKVKEVNMEISDNKLIKIKQ